MVTGVSETARSRALIAYKVRPHPRRDRIVVALSAIVICIVAVQRFDAKAPVPLMGTRADHIAASIAVLDRGGPLLLSSDVPYRPGIAVRHLQPIVGDDEGIYVYLPELSRLTGEHDPGTLMKWLFMGCFGLLVLVYPLIVYELFGSVVGAVASPLLVMWRFDFTQRLDLYWILAWCMLLCIPGLVLAWRWWGLHRKRAIVLLIAVTVAASFATSIRIHAGLPILLGGLGIVLTTQTRWWRSRSALVRFWRLPRWWVRPALAAALVLAYLSIATIGFAAIRAHRNGAIHDAHFGSSSPTQHPFWHNAYIGLGYLPNKYGIQWFDDVAVDAVERAQPGTGFLTTKYEATLRHLWFQIAEHDPGFVLRGFWTKARVVVADAVERFWLALVLLPAALLAGKERRMMRVAAAIAIPAALLGALAPILTIPLVTYELAWLGTWGALWVMLIVWAWVHIRDAATAEIPADIRPAVDAPAAPNALDGVRARLHHRAVWATGIALVVALVLGAAARPAAPPSSDALYATGQGGFVDSSWLDRPAAASWSFSGSLPAGWSSEAGTFVEPDGGVGQRGLYVRSPKITSATQLTGPDVMLQPGSYALLASVRGLVGGFTMSVATSDGTQLGAGNYSWETPNVLGDALYVPFSVAEPTRAHVAFSSWTSVANANSWIVRKVAIVPDGVADAQRAAAADAGFYKANATPLAPGVRGRAVRSWSFTGGLPVTWGPLADEPITAFDGETHVTTTLAARGGQIWMPALVLPPGRYELDLRGRVLAGGLLLRALDPDTNQTLGASMFWSAQAFDKGVMRVPFAVHRSGAITRFELDNWAATNHVSTWSIRRAWLRRTG
jgi:hypothetical protein